ncbi:MAG: CoA transferase subunit A [Candidatus Hodarchaeales archaeon]|jgi:glutaconate CoA-transferase subunit A
MRSNKRTTLKEAVESTIKPGISIAIGGVHFHNSPMMIIREIIRQKIPDLTLIGGFALGIQIDMLVGAGLVNKIICPYIGFEHFGLAPNTKYALENNLIKIVECEAAFTLYGLRAAAEGLPFHPYPAGMIEDTDHPLVNPDYKNIKSPYDKKDYYVVPALKPDVALIHCQQADQSGYGIYQGAASIDELMSESAERVILTCDEIVPLEWIQQNHIRTIILSHFTDYVIEAPYAAHPCSSHGHYRYDNKHYEKYIKMAKNPSTFQEYLNTFVYQPKSHFRYLKAAGGKAYLDKLRIS